MKNAEGSITPSASRALDRWPSLRIADWQATRDTLQLWTQVAGKVRMANTPLEGLFYSYAYPEPDGFRDAPVTPADASYNVDLGEFVLPYEVVRTAPDPDQMLLDFLQTTYEAAATNAKWDRHSRERNPTTRVASESSA